MSFSIIRLSLIHDKIKGFACLPLVWWLSLLSSLLLYDTIINMQRTATISPTDSGGETWQTVSDRLSFIFDGCGLFFIRLTTWRYVLAPSIYWKSASQSRFWIDWVSFSIDVAFFSIDRPRDWNARPVYSEFIQVYSEFIQVHSKQDSFVFRLSLYLCCSTTRQQLRCGRNCMPLVCALCVCVASNDNYQQA